MFYIIENEKIVGVSEYEPLTALDVVESQELWAIDDNFVSGVFSKKQNTFDEELKALDDIYEVEALRLSNEYMIAMARDGANETAKVTAVREKITGLDLSYEQDVLALIAKYSGV